jgi:D-sedoheptulose 7-phosphate isomerase
MYDTVAARHPALAPLRDAVIAAVGHLCDCHRRGGLVMVCGNGGSAADSAHIVGELAKGFMHRRPLEPQTLERILSVAGADSRTLFSLLQRGIRAINLADATSLNTAVANDLSAELVFAQSVQVFGRPGDVLLGISTSGNSANVVRAMQVGRALGVTTLGLTGQKVGKMDAFCDLLLKAPATETYQVQEFHLPLYHALCFMTEAELFGA